MTIELKQTRGYAVNGAWYDSERQALLASMSIEEEAVDSNVYDAVLYGDGSVIVMDKNQIVIDRFVDKYTAEQPTQYEVNT